MSRIRVADYIAAFLEQQGCEAVFLLAGGGMMHLLDAVGRRDTLRYYCNHHEQCCAMAADGYARRSGRLGVCYVTSGPGGTNTVTGVTGAFQDSSPVLFISGQSKVSQTIQGSGLSGLRQFGTFEVDIIPIVQSVTKYAAFVGEAKSIRYHLERAVDEARSGRPGPVFLDIPVDIQGALVDPDELEGYLPPDVLSASLLPVDLERLQASLRMAERPLILAGHGVRCAAMAERFLRFIEACQLPVVTTGLAIDLLPFNHPLFVGHPGMKGDRAGNLAIQACDWLLVLGSSLHVTTTGYELDRFSPHSHKIQIEPDPWVLQRESVGVQHKIRADLALAIPQLIEHVEPALTPARAGWLEHCQAMKRELQVRNEPHTRTDGKIHYYDVVEALSELCAETDTLVTDAGSAFYVVGQAFRVKRGQRVLVSGALGIMGYALPAATGAALADPEHCVVCLTGDGSLQTNVHELGVLAHYALNVKVVVVNNGGYVSIRNTQNNFFGGYLVGTDPGSGVSMPNLGKLAEAHGLAFRCISQPDDLAPVLREVLACRGPVVCEIVTAQTQEILPTVTSVRREDGSMESKPLHEMYPFLPADQLNRWMSWRHKAPSDSSDEPKL